MNIFIYLNKSLETNSICVSCPNFHMLNQTRKHSCFFKDCQVSVLITQFKQLSTIIFFNYLKECHCICHTHSGGNQPEIQLRVSEISVSNSLIPSLCLVRENIISGNVCKLSCLHHGSQERKWPQSQPVVLSPALHLLKA